MDWQFTVGIGIAIMFGLLPFAVKDMPHWITWPGITAGALLTLLGLLPSHDKYPLIGSLVMVASISAFVGSIALFVDARTDTAMEATSTSVRISEPSLTPPQEKLLSLIAKYQRNFAVTKLIIGR